MCSETAEPVSRPRLEDDKSGESPVKSGRCLLASPWLILPDAQVGDLRPAIDHGGHEALGGVVGKLDAFGHASPIAFARATSFTARCTTGGSIIFEPRLTTETPRC